MLRVGPSAPPPQGPPMPPGGAPPQAGGPPPELLAALAQAGGGAPDAQGPPSPDTSGSGKPPKFDAEKVDQKTVVYMTSDMGPFQCDHCEHFDAPKSCVMVQGDIDPGGCCNLFTPAQGGPPTDPDNDGDNDTNPQGDTDQDMGAAPPPPIPGAQ